MADLFVRLIRWCFTRFYTEFSWTYDTVAAAVSWGHWRSWALATLPLLHGDVLEIGCGTGNVQQGLADRSATTRVVGLDRSWPMLLHTRRKAPAACLLQADARALPIRDQSFDCVVATFPSEYIAAPSTLAEVARILRPGGQLVILLGAQLTGPDLYRRAIGLAYRLVLQSPPAPVADLPASGTAAALLTAMHAAGLAAHDRWVPAPGGAVYLIEATR